MDQLNTAYLIIGTNLGNKKENLEQAIQWIEQYAGTITSRSDIYETEPWGISEQPGFYNQVLKIATTLQAEDLLQALLSIEKEMGRIRAEKYGARIIDIDILFYNNEVHHSRHLTVPHPHMTKRNFVLVPLAEIAGQVIHPLLHLTVDALLEASTDHLAVKKVGT